MSTEIDYKRMMNGYPDPKTWAAERERMRQEEEELRFRGVPFMPSSGSGGGGGERQCGYRKEGGTYAEVPTSRNGKPLEHFITCVPVPIDAGEYRLNPKGLGVQLIDLPEDCLICLGSGETVKQENGRALTGACSACGGLGKVPVTHIFDIVGQDNYPNVADFLEEVRRLGVSRRLELDGDGYARLSSRSRLIMLHRRAAILNSPDFYKAIEEAPGGAVDTEGLLELQRMRRAGCPKALSQHEDFYPALPRLKAPRYEAPGCARLWHHCIEGGEAIPERMAERLSCPTCSGSGRKPEVQAFEPCSNCQGVGKLELEDEITGRFVERHLACGTYRGYSLPEGFKPEYALGIFAIFPLVKITVIDPEGRYQDRVERAKRAGVDVSVEEY